MSERIAAVDTYIEQARPFAKPILVHLRDVVHAACPQVEESMKWSFPNFGYKGMLCNMAAFKEHVAFGFWKHALLAEQADLPGGLSRDAMGSFGRITSLSDLPPKRQLVALVRLAMKLNDEGVKAPRRQPGTKAAIRPPAAFTRALRANRKAASAFAAFPPGHRREYLEWITEAKTDATRDRRIATAIEWIAEGKPRNWKYAARK